MEHVFRGEPALKDMHNANRTMLYHFVQAIKTNVFCAHCNIGRLHVTHLLN